MRLLGVEYKIIFVDRWQDVDKEEQELGQGFGHVRGLINYENKTIRIWNGKHRHLTSIQQTYLHEVLHAICQQFSIAADEDDICRLSAGLLAFILENNIKLPVK